MRKEVCHLVIMEDERPRRVNGLSPPYTGAQLSTWILLPVLVLQFLFFSTPLLPLEASIPCTLCFIALAGFSTYFAYVAMNIDPADPRLEPHDPISESRWETDAPTKQCWICDKQVGEKSMHCKYCNKCVDHFDHHCMWLNTCVGKANYKFFFRTMVSITGMLFINSAIQIAILIAIYRGDGEIKLNSEKWFNADATTAIVVVTSIFLAVDIGALLLIGQLLVFHIRLQKEELTTYAFIVRENQRRRERVKFENELTARRQHEIFLARTQGRSIYQIQLIYGGCLRNTCGLKSCDPLPEERTQSAKELSSVGNEHPLSSPASPAITRNISGVHAEEEKEPEVP